LFVTIFGYTLNPETNFNLTTELKNAKDSKKADGGIIIDGTVVGVIELKGTNTTDLAKVEPQAFGYKNNQQDCVYVITSNFEKLRFYIDNAIEHIEFNLFTLSEEAFQLLYVCIAFENIKKNLPKKLKEESLSQEENITKQLYKDYSLFKRELFQNLTQLNPQFEALELFKKSQKLLDRFLFLFFSEDRNLLPPNSVRLILEQWKKLKDLDAYTPLYDRFKKYFGYLNTGFKGKQYDVFAYNGGLFKPDTILANITIDDELLYTHTLKLSEYDFESEVDVNILGHIFENSLNELDEVKAQLEGQSVDKTTTKRKKDGVFYTPKYITKYIVENTVGKLCTEKKIELDISDETYQHAKQRSRKRLETLNDYRTWLLQLTICDPACGSGAFLNEALNFLIAEHRYVDELSAKYNNDALMLSDVENSILENNLFGVDLNEESVEIAKLSLWLRTAQPNRKLNSLNHNIKCGNSLIDDPEVAGDKAFKWEEEFPSIFKEKHKKPYHITTTIHDSRTSKRMEKYKVRERREGSTKPHVIYFTPEDDVQMTQIIADVVKEDNLNILAYNICGDHIHLLVVCTIEEVAAIMQKIKGRTSYFHKGHYKGFYKGLKPLVNKPLWQQKYSPPKEVTSTEQLLNTLKYIQTNRNKHELPPHPKALQNTINALCCSEADAFRSEYAGGFDVVIGNPPYVQIQSMGAIANDLKNQGFKTFEKTGDLYCLFYELGTIILKEKGILGFITSNKWMRAKYGKSLRNYIIDNTQPIEIIDLGSGIFESATVDSNLIIFEKNSETTKKSFNAIDLSKEKTFLDFTIYKEKTVEINPDLNENWVISNPIELKIKKKIEKIGTPLKDWNIKINRGILTGLNDAFVIDESTKNKLIKKAANNSEIIKPILRGRDLNRYYVDYCNLYLINTHNGYKEKSAVNIEEYQDIKEHLDAFQPQLTKRGDKGITPYNLRNCAYVDDFFKENIFYPDICQRLSFSIVDNMFSNNTGYYLNTNNKYLLNILNSNLINYYYKTISAQLGETGIRCFTIYIENIPIPKIKNLDQQPFILKADQMLSLNKALQELSQKFQRTLLREYESLYKLSKKLETWYALSYADFLKELQKKKVVLSLSKKVELETYFLEEQQKAVALKTEIDQTDKEIDAMVYALYGLTEAEIAIVESC
jgi:type I restriction-modification system DNA methylase subunit/REP element-mobilizing transposase RayT